MRGCFHAIGLVASVDVGGKVLFLCINHFKSMLEGEDKTHNQRKEQAGRVGALIDGRWKTQEYRGNFAVLRVFNDYPQVNTALTTLLNHSGLENIVARLLQDEQWTHISISVKRNTNSSILFCCQNRWQKQIPWIQALCGRRLPLRADNYKSDRFKGVGKDTPKASDRAPLYMDLVLE